MSLVTATLFRHAYVPPANITLRKIDQDEIDRRKKSEIKEAQRAAAKALYVTTKEKTASDILNAIKDGHLTMDSMVLATGLAKATIVNHLNDLVEKKQVIADKSQRPFVFRLWRKIKSQEVTK